MREKALLAIEENLTRAFMEEYESKVDPQVAEFAEAVGAGEFDTARQLALDISFDEVAAALEGRIEFYGLAALFFGAGNANGGNAQDSKTMAAGKPEIMQYAVRQAKNMIVHSAQAVRDDLLAYVETVVAETAPVQKAENRVIRDFTSAAYARASGKSQRQLQTVASLHSTRLAGWGFLNEADLLGETVYEINEVLDGRTCAVCYEMHGKQFQVAGTFKSLDNQLRIDNPDDLKELSPWPKNTKAGVDQLRSLNTNGLLANGWTHPPFHPFCRGLLGYAGTAPSLDDPEQELDDLLAATESMDGQPLATGSSGGTVRPATLEDFTATMNYASEVEVAQFNELLGGRVLPKDLLDGIVGPLRPEGDTTTPLILVHDGEVEISYFKQGVGSVHRIIERTKSGELRAYHKMLRVDRSNAGTGRAMLASAMAVYQKAGVGYIDMHANIDVGGYAWARYGFSPNAGSWASLKPKITAELDELLEAGYLGDTVADTVRSLLARDDPKTLWQIADLRAPIGPDDIPLGRRLLQGREWLGSLSLSDRDAMDRFEAYVGVQQ